MNAEEQGALLRAWRNYVGEVRGRPLTLKEAAALIAEEAERQGVRASARSLPRSHASLTRWELGNVEQSASGLGLIAKAYGVNAYDLMTRLPPQRPQNGDVTPAGLKSHKGK